MSRLKTAILLKTMSERPEEQQLHADDLCRHFDSKVEKVVQAIVADAKEHGF
jgi:hypothetical protein